MIRTQRPTPAGLTAALFGVLAFALVPAASHAQRNLAIADFFALPELSNPQVSPDGARVAYELESADLEEDEWSTALWVVEVATGEARRLSAPDRSDSHPRWSPDGRYLAFLSSRPAKAEDDDPEAQVWAYDLRGGDAQALTATKESIRAFEWSPDSKRLVLEIRDPDPNKPADDEKDDDEKEKPKPVVTERRQFKRDYSGYLTARYTHLYTWSLAVPLAERKLVQLTTGSQDDSEPAWRPDGGAIAFTSNRTGDQDANTDTNVFVVEVAADGAPGALRQVTTNPGADGSAVWSPDGRSIAHLTQTEPKLLWYATQNLATVPAAGGQATVLTASFDRFIHSPRYSPDGREILFAFEESGEQQLAAIPASGGAGSPIRRITSGPRMVSAFHQGANGALVGLSSEPQQPAELYVLDPAAEEPPRRLTRTHEKLLGELRLGEVRETTVKSADGTPVETFLFLPPVFESGHRYPTILWIHGGPVGQYDWGFDFLPQLFAAHGYVVVQPNPRGSSGQGQDFCKAIFADWGNKDYEDLMAAVDHAVAQGIADPAKLGVGGWSYGGIMTDNVIVKTTRFAAAISGAGEGLNISNFGHDHYQLEWELELGLPWENRELWERLSPFNQIEKVTTPTMFMGGALDWNVPILGSEQMYQALKRLGRTTQLVVYPGEHHGIERPSFQRDRFERYLTWYARFLGGKAAAPAPPKPDTSATAKP
jgi:dipeptidyl aminopeptidase/acylaminoacyl peptidase